MSIIDDVLEAILEGKKNPSEIASELKLDREEVEGAINILQSLGYVERIEKGSNACSSCPLKKVCGGSCVLPKSRTYVVTEKAFSLKNHSQ